MTFPYESLFTPLKIGKLTIKNRYALAPMGVAPHTAMGTFSNDGEQFLVDCAKGGFGLVCTGSLGGDFSVDDHKFFNKIYPLYNPRGFIRSSSFMNQRIHAYGAASFCQISLGPGRNGSGTAAPSELPFFFNPSQKTHALTRDEIKRKVDSYLASAEVVRSAEFDGLEIHAMHWGYLLDEFAMSFMNHRTDEYGGTLENRLRVARELVEGIKERCGKDFPVIMRVSLKSYLKDFNKGSLHGDEEVGRTLEEAIKICQLLESYGFDAISADVGLYESFYHACPPMYIPKCSYIPLAAEVKKAIHIPLFLANRMNDPDLCAEAVRDGKIDAVVLGRAALADPNYVQKVARNETRRIRPCLACNQGCLGRTLTTNAASCAVNPSVMRGKSYALCLATQKKRVMIVGGGVAGMEAARVTALRGHHVVLCESSDQLGGNLLPAGAHAFKEDVRALNRWYQDELCRLPIEIRKNTTVTVEDIRREAPDAVILATGSTPVMPPIKGIEHGISSVEALSGTYTFGQRVVIVGGGLVGCEIALELASMEKKKVTIVEALDRILAAGGPVPLMNKMCLEEMLADANVTIHTSGKVEEICADKVYVSFENGKKITIPADDTIIATGFRSRPSMASELLGSGMEVYEIGDGRAVGSILTSIWDAYEVARGIE